ncbi:hypothetical protein B0J13DRAFT_550875 [Dactylonectria estremocensis]|uniref:Uncharacterized protein n=1 Tax=Dactylonectria estremocensis TaxID=1079267 RepID=A0A9P9EZ84_9HYPO|nr:hypothetical protein B0J13DRAFT_550875 [Dactylonectria estremocensis]
MSRTASLFNCLIRTHHITSRKKVQRVRRAASQLKVDWVLIRSGGSPGIMFAESRDEVGLVEWVATVQALRYKDFRCAVRPGPASVDGEESRQKGASGVALRATGFDETESVAEFAKEMDIRGLGAWWKRGMGYETDG